MMDLGVNRAEPQVMHIDLNSAFAMIEQQANPFLRGKPVAMTNRLTRGATIIAASYEAKKYGIGVGTKLAEALDRVPGLVALETDPPKYLHAYRQFEKILTSYSPDAHMKSIDEGIIDFSGARLMHARPLLEIGLEIKARIKEALGPWVTCNIGIGPSRWLAKQAAGLHKPDGLDIVNWRNLTDMYSQMELMDLTGINRRYNARLKIYGINTPMDFLAASQDFLRRQVFQSITGYYWYLRLRGWEVDASISATKSVGRQYVLHHWTNDNQELAKVLLKMSAGMGRRLRNKQLAAQGIYIGCMFTNHQHWQARRKFKTQLFTTQELFDAAWSLFHKRESKEPVKAIFVSCYGLLPAAKQQTQLFAAESAGNWDLMRVVDKINDRYGELSVMPAAMIGTEGWVPDKIPFGTTRHF